MCRVGVCHQQGGEGLGLRVACVPCVRVFRVLQVMCYDVSGVVCFLLCLCDVPGSFGGIQINPGIETQNNGQWGFPMYIYVYIYIRTSIVNSFVHVRQFIDHIQFIIRTACT